MESEVQPAKNIEMGTVKLPFPNAPRLTHPLQVRIQLPLVDSCTQTDVACAPNAQFSPSILLHPYAYRSVPLSDYYPTVSPDSYSVAECACKSDSMAHTQNGSTFEKDKEEFCTASKVANIEGENIVMLSVKEEKKRKKPRSALSSYLVALRPWSFPGSITPVALGVCLAYKFQGIFDLYIFVTTVLTALCVHAAGNLVNTYFDFVRGIDNKKSDDRTLVDSLLTPNDVVRLGALLYVAGCCGFVLLALISAARMEHLALIYFCGLSSSFLYTGGLGLKYIAMGDILIVLTFGPLTVVFSHLSQTGQLSLVPLVYAVPLALNAEAILHANNARDAESDRQAGAVTLAILLGKGGSYSLFCFLLFTPFLMFITVGVHYCAWMLVPAAGIFPAFGLEKEFRRGSLKLLPQHVARLNLLIGLLYIVGLCMADAKALPSMTPIGA
ncbi:ubia prenyltransferase domain-containing protein 1-like [Plakobranchus ocellatus]|uniref:Ubia prenyltransferase domain-containing protein 1-like n=1 Tax=Plakobranchus ocellatus TaxID=259542 RepID=A0AAV4DDE8_9GAST|nr:ubia prenyltransferase domain-containing protein 1-like [Plakobranchus ocellatus]